MKSPVLFLALILSASVSHAGDVALKCTLSGKNIATKSAVVQLKQEDDSQDSSYLVGEAKLGELKISLSRSAYETKAVLYHSCGFAGLGCAFGGHGTDVGLPTGKDYRIYLEVRDAKDGYFGSDEIDLKHSYSKGSISIDGTLIPTGQQNEIKANVTCETI